MVTKSVKGETAYYPVVRDWLDGLLAQYFTSHYLEITAYGKFSNVLKGQMPQHREIVFAFLKEAAPDITGFTVRNHEHHFVVVELKDRVIKLDDIYQTKKYAELFDAHYALLISTEEIPNEIIRLSNVVSPYLLAVPAYGKLTFVHIQFSAGARSAIGSATWFPHLPFEKG